MRVLCEHKTTQKGILHIQIQNKSLVLERKQKSPGVTAPLCVRTKKTPILGLFYSWPAVFKKNTSGTRLLQCYFWMKTLLLFMT